MRTSSDILFDLIKNSKVELLSVTQKYGSMPGEMHRMTTYEFIKDLEHLVKSGVFNNVDWKFEQKSETVLLLTSNNLENLCDTYLAVEIMPFGEIAIQQVIDILKETIFSKPVHE